MRVVLDTNVVVSGYLWAGDHHLLDLQKYQGIRIVTATQAMDVAANLSR